LGKTGGPKTRNCLAKKKKKREGEINLFEKGDPIEKGLQRGKGETLGKSLEKEIAILNLTEKKKRRRSKNIKERVTSSSSYQKKKRDF